MANSRLDPYREEILQMVRARRTQAQIIHHLATEYGVTIRKSTLSEYLKKQAGSALSLSATDLRVSPEEENFLAQTEVYTELQASAQALLEKMNDVQTALRETGNSVYTLTTETESRDSALQAGLQQLQHTLASLPQSTGIPANPPNSPNPPNRPPEHPPPVPRALIVQIWKRAFLLTGALWLVVFLLLRRYVFGP